MSTKLEERNGVLEASKSSKKRKHDPNVKESSKKKRKHDKVEIPSKSETPSDVRGTKEKKAKIKKAEADFGSPVLSPEISPVIHETQETSELPNTPNEHPVDEIEVDGSGEAIIGDGLIPSLVQEIDPHQLESEEPTSFYSTRISLCLPISPISLASATSSILAQHLAPLLLTYFAPAGGIILSFSDPVLSARPEVGLNLPLKPPKKGKIPKNPPGETFSRVGDEFGACWVWLTATFLVFRPEPGNELSGWTNVTSEDFIGLISYNYFQTSVGKSRIPRSWQWVGPTRGKGQGRRRARKGKLKDSEGPSQETVETYEPEGDLVQEDTAMDGIAGWFLDADGAEVPFIQRLRVVDLEMVPGHERGKWSLQIEGSLLSLDEEAEAREEEKRKFEYLQQRNQSRAGTPIVPLMSGGLAPISRAVSVVSSQ